MAWYDTDKTTARVVVCTTDVVFSAAIGGITSNLLHWPDWAFFILWAVIYLAVLFIYFRFFDEHFT